MTECDVTILGGGPVGCLMSILLSDVGVSNIVIDRDTEPYQLPRAIVMDDEIQRVFIRHRMGEWLSANTSRLEAADFVDAQGNQIMGLDIPEKGPQGVPPVVCHYQPDLDAMLRSEAGRRGAEVRWGRTAMEMDHDNVVVTTLDDGEKITSRWFVGCDGASSWTRKQLGLTLEDLHFDQEWIVVDIELNEAAAVDLPLGVRQYCDPVRPATYVKGHRRYRRWEFQVQEHEDASQLDTSDGLWRLLAPWVGPSDARIVRSAVYRFHAVVAPRMQEGNVFLAGDAAHQMPPFLGQGLNSGMRDAVNLAWKMGFVHHGRANENLLDTYSTERVPHVRSVVAHAADMGRLIDQLAGRESHGIDHAAGYGGARPPARIEAGLVTGDDPRVGQPAPYHPASAGLSVDRFVVHTATEIALPDDIAVLDPVHIVAPELLKESSAMIVRPDGYIAAVAASEQDLESVGRRIRTALGS